MPFIATSASRCSSLATPALSFFGLVICAWLWFSGAGAAGLPGCGAGSGCEAVTRSRWAKWLGVPVAGPAAGVYALVLAASVAAAPSPGGQAGRLGRAVLLAAAPLLASAAVWFVSLQALVLRRLCPYCLLLHALGLAVAAAVALNPSAGGAGWACAELPQGELTAVLSAGAVAATALVLGQVLVRPRTYVVKEVGGAKAREDSAGAGETSAGADNGDAETAGSGAGEGAVAPAPAAAPASGGPCPPNPYLGRRVVAGRVPLQMGAWPVVGEPGAAEVLVFLFCYTCRNCRHLYGLLEERMGREPGRRSVMLVPVPTEPGCNPTIRNCGPEHTGACAYARLALWAWAADWSKFEAFNRFLFEGERPPAMEAARERAGALAGRPAPDPREAEPGADRLIAMAVNLYRSAGSGLTPTLLLPRGYAAGHIPTAEKLAEVLDGRAGPLTGAQPERGGGPKPVPSATATHGQAAGAARSSAHS